MLQNILFEVERYKRQKCQDSDLVYYTRLKELQHEEDWEIKQKLTVVNGFWRETIFLWRKVSIKVCGDLTLRPIGTVSCPSNWC